MARAQAQTELIIQENSDLQAALTEYQQKVDVEDFQDMYVFRLPVASVLVVGHWCAEPRLVHFICRLLGDTRFQCARDDTSRTSPVVQPHNSRPFFLRE